MVDDNGIMAPDWSAPDDVTLDVALDAALTLRISSPRSVCSSSYALQLHRRLPESA
jgi:hypothetical protein